MDLEFDLVRKILLRLNEMTGGGGGGGSGTVTSVGFTAPSIFSVAGSPVTTSGTLALTFAGGQAQNQFLASPDGSSGALGMRSIAATDIPDLDASKITSGAFNTARLGSGTADSTKYLRGDGTWQTLTSGSGTVTSVALTAPAEISVAGSPVTTSGTFALTWASAAQNGVFAGPSGSAGTPAFRALVAGDIPNLDAAKITTGTMATARLGSGGTANTVLHGNQVFSAVDVNSDTTGNLSLTRIATIANNTILGNVSGSTAAPVALTATQATTILNVFGPDSGAGGLKGLVPATAAGDAVKFLRGDGTWVAGNAGTVTSINLTAPSAGITVSGGPITTSGSITLALADDLAALEALSSTGYAKRTGTATWTVGTAISLTADVSGVLPVANGGTSQSSYTKGDILAAAGSTTLNKLGVGTDGQILTADAASTNGVKWATSSGITGSLTSGRVTLSTGTTTVGDDAAFLFSSASSVGTLTLGNAANGIVLGGAKLILKSASNSNIELTPQGTGNVDLTTAQLLVPNGSNSLPSIAGRSDPDTGIVFDPAGANGIGMATGGLLNWYCDGFAFFFNSTRVRPLTNDVTTCGEDDTRWTLLNARHVMANTRTVTVDTTLDRTYQIVFVNSASARTITLPSAVTSRVSNGNSAVYVIKNLGAGTVTVAASAGTVEQTSITTNQSYTYTSDGTNWYVY